jgi:hypothetical protein
METGMKIGGIDFSSVEDPSKDIVNIMKAHVSEAVILAGLDAYSSVASVDGAVIQNCTITGDRTITIDKDFN